MVDFLALGIVFHFGKCFFEVYEAQSLLTQRDVKSIAKRPLSFEHLLSQLPIFIPLKIKIELRSIKKDHQQ